MDFAQVHQDLRHKLSELVEEMERAEKERAAVEERIETLTLQIRELEQEERVLRRVAVRYDIEPPRDGLLPREVEEWRALPRTDAVLRVLKEAGRPMSPAEITKALAAKGRSDLAHLVSAALAYLKDGRVVRLGHGQWATPGEEPAEPSVRVGGVAVPDYLSSYQADTQEPASGPGQDAE